MTWLVVAAVLWTAPVTVEPGDGPWAAAPLPPAVDRRTGDDLTTLRLLDGTGHEVPYRLLAPGRGPSPRWVDAPLLNRGQVADGWIFELELPAAARVDGLSLDLEGDEGVAELEARAPSGAVVADGARVGRIGDTSVRTVELGLLDLERIEIRLRLLLGSLQPTGARIRLLTGPVPPAAGPPLGFEVGHQVDQSGVSTTVLQASEAARIERVSLQIGAPGVFSRAVTVQAFAGSRRGWVLVGRGTVERVPLADGSAGLERLEVPIRSGVWRRLRVVEHHRGERPLELLSASARRRPLWIAFPAGAGPLHLEHGDRPRSRTLEERAPALDPAEMRRAAIGTLEETVTEDAARDDRGELWIRGLFVVAAGLLGLLAWRVFRRP